MTKMEKQIRKWRTAARYYGVMTINYLKNPDATPALIKATARAAFHQASLARRDGYFGEGRNRDDGPVGSEG